MGTASTIRSDYFQQLYEWAIQLITSGKPTYVISVDQIREYRGTLTGPGREEPVPCTLEVDNSRPYNWFIKHLGICPSRQYEFELERADLFEIFELGFFRSTSHTVRIPYNGPNNGWLYKKRTDHDLVRPPLVYRTNG